MRLNFPSSAMPQQDCSKSAELSIGCIAPLSLRTTVYCYMSLGEFMNNRGVQRLRPWLQAGCWLYTGVFLLP